MAHQLSCDDEHSDGAINQHYRCCLFGTRRRNRIGSICTCGNILVSDLYAGVWTQHWSAGYDCPKKWGTTLQRSRAHLLSGIIFSVGDGNHAFSVDTACFSVYSATADYF